MTQIAHIICIYMILNTKVSHYRGYVLITRAVADFNYEHFLNLLSD